VKDFAQDLRLLGMLRHAIHLGLELLRGDRPLPPILQRFRIAQITFDLLFDLRLRHHCIERWLRIVALLWPDAVTPVNFFDRALVSNSISKCQRLRLSGDAQSRL
jgi:hypothetical protein